MMTYGWEYRADSVPCHFQRYNFGEAGAYFQTTMPKMLRKQHHAIIMSITLFRWAITLRWYEKLIFRYEVVSEYAVMKSNKNISRAH